LSCGRLILENLSVNTNFYMAIQLFVLLDSTMQVQIKRTRIEDLRRGELIAAAHRVFMRHGLSGMTTARICAEAGMSPGILSYYFKGKEDVLFAMVRMNNRLLMEDVVVRLSEAHTRWERFLAIIEGNFPVGVYERNVASAWLSVVAASSGNMRYARLQAVFYRRLRSNLGSVFKEILSAERFALMERTVSSLIDGLWLRKSAGDPMGRDDAVAALTIVVEGLLTEDERRRLKQT
jgi:TetR/AcrR family transcriptional regulator, transcriptional repressor of bet genes